MISFARVLSAGVLAVILGTSAGCGGSTADDANSVSSDSGTSLKRSGGTGSTAASVAISPASVDRNAPATITLYPGSYMNQMLFVKWQCYQGGAMLAHDGSSEFHGAVSQAVPGYALVGDHFQWTFVLADALNYSLGTGPATCNLQAWYENKRLQWFQIASSTFDVQ